MRISRTRGAALAGVASLSLAAAGLALVAPAAQASTGAHRHVSGMAHHQAAAVAGTAVNNEFNPYASSINASKIPGVKQWEAKQRQLRATRATAAATGQETLSYGGGVDGIGVQSGHSKVYLVFYGTQWGTQTTDANGNLKFSGDSAGAAGAAQQMFKGIGTNGETWSADLTQWCDGPNVASGAVSCPSNANFIPYQSGGVLSGVWYDNAGASPAGATGNQLAQEAISAAGHFGNTTSAANRDAYYVILSPHGTDPDNYEDPNTGYCAWHDWNGDTTLTGGAASSPYGDIAFSNQPYNIDQGANCGVGFVNSPGTTDGFTMTLGHEWHEMMSDQNPAGGWTNHVSGSSYNGQENSDECAWLKPGTAGGAANISFGSFGSYAEQASWSNDTNACAISHTILTHGNTVTVTNPGNQSGTVGTAASLQVSGSDSASGQTLTYSATGLPAGLSISSTGLISGTPSAAGTSSVTVTAKDTTGATGSTSFTWTEATSGGGGGSSVTNGGFEAGSFSGWTTTGNATVIAGAAHSGSYGAMLGSTNPSTTSTAAQTFTAASGTSHLSFYYSNTCPDTVTYDWATATLKDNTTGTTTTILAKTCASSSAWTPVTANVTAGHSYTLTLTNVDDNYPGDPTYTYYDDVTVS
ncbi:putative Ig domain-containing protein [Streptacidiphilus jiangxiensis]|uniref:Serine protease n=1 Tax=Streptacidiphilus jiangxiensis TaxID=235985 RepID=A0A1H7G0X2_STRJI|nr:putative Ig domain-containing protein [Streptacidiphilus jiangxiensis]SEK32003.1 serine protease [Streptacidiphilus jiangxiensis]